jgi:hypothetical protein
MLAAVSLPDDGVVNNLRSVGELKVDYTAKHLRREPSNSLS